MHLSCSIEYQALDQVYGKRIHIHGPQGSPQEAVVYSVIGLGKVQFHKKNILESGPCMLLSQLPREQVIRDAPTFHKSCLLFVHQFGYHWI